MENLDNPNEIFNQKHPQLRYYVINLPQCSDRKERLLHRLDYHKIIDKTKFITGLDKNSPLLNWFEAGVIHPYTSTREEHACFLSHIKALRAFVDDPDAKEAIILEDDAMFHNNFIKQLDYVLDWTSGVNLIMLCFLANTWEGTRKVTEEKIEDFPEFYTIGPKIFGAQGYWLSKDYAEVCLSRLDRPLRHISEKFITSELITRLSGGYFVKPPLLIEEGVYSTLRKEKYLDIQRKYFDTFGIDNYTAAEPVEIKSIWKPIGFNPIDSN